MALTAKALAQAQAGESGALVRQNELRGLATCVEALYVDPHLPQDPNFYENRVVYASLRKAKAIFDAAAKDAAPVPDDPTAQACRQATQELEALLKAGKQREALHLLYKLTGTLKAYFLEFHRHASPEVQGFAGRLHPMLLKHAQPKMRTFGKVLGILIARGKQAPQAAPAAAGPLHPAFRRTMAALEQGQQATAARELALALAARPELVKQKAHAREQTVLNLCREIKGKLDNVDLERFKRGAA